MQNDEKLRKRSANKDFLSVELLCGGRKPSQALKFPALHTFPPSLANARFALGRVVERSALLVCCSSSWRRKKSPHGLLLRTVRRFTKISVYCSGTGCSAVSLISREWSSPSRIKSMTTKSPIFFSFMISIIALRLEVSTPSMATI